MFPKFHVYKAEISIYHYWKNSVEGGYITEDIYFTDKDEARAYAEREINYEYDINENKVPLMDKRNKGHYNISYRDVF